jgi:hypothetical protein
MEAVLGLIFIVIIFQVLSGIWSGLTSPKYGAPFTCKTCGGAFKHNDRTIAATKEKKRPVCYNCHSAHRAARKPSGCFGVIILGAIIPTVTILTVVYYL